jgi:hypothetical protein
MADTEALESLAEILPADRREQFFAFVSKFRSRPEDDDHFQLLEAIGFIMLVMKEIPDQIAGIIDQAQGKLGQSESEQLRSEIVAVLNESLDTPSYKDLRETMLAIRDHEARFRQKVDGLQKQLAKAEQAAKRTSSFGSILAVALAAGLASASIIAALIKFGMPLVQPRNPFPMPEKLKPYAALLERGQLDYFELETPERGRAGMYLIGGGAKEAFIDGTHGIVVGRPYRDGALSKP